MHLSSITTHLYTSYNRIHRETRGGCNRTQQLRVRSRCRGGACLRSGLFVFASLEPGDHVCSSNGIHSSESWVNDRLSISVFFFCIRKWCLVAWLPNVHRPFVTGAAGELWTVGASERKSLATGSTHPGGSWAKLSHSAVAVSVSPGSPLCL